MIFTELIAQLELRGFLFLKCPLFAIELFFGGEETGAAIIGTFVDGARA